jgi:hypothetical protein
VNEPLDCLGHLPTAPHRAAEEVADFCSITVEPELDETDREVFVVVRDHPNPATGASSGVHTVANELARLLERNLASSSDSGWRPRRGSNPRTWAGHRGGEEDEGASVVWRDARAAWAQWGQYAASPGTVDYVAPGVVAASSASCRARIWSTAAVLLLASTGSGL